MRTPRNDTLASVNSLRHPGLVPGSTVRRATSRVARHRVQHARPRSVARWTPAQGRGDGSAVEVAA